MLFAQYRNYACYIIKGIYNMKKTLLSLSLSMLFASNTFAYVEVDAKSLVGHGYGGIHYTRFDADENRYQDEGLGRSFLDDGSGFGGELGYRFSEYNELRIQYTDLTIETDPNRYGDVEGSSVGLDLLHFPTKKSLYVLGGFRELDLEDDALSANVGLGYRLYLTDRFAAYAEAKGHYQFDDSQKDFSTTFGIMYFFGSNSAKPAPIKKATVAPKPVTKPRPVVKDTDGDGVIDANDQCPNTPTTDKVDSNGCTIFTEEMATMELLVNFDNNKDEIKTQYLSEIERAVEFMKTYKHVNLTIEGHTSAQGNAAYNKALSAKRANAVVDLMVNTYGIDESRLTAIGYGEEQLISDANTAAAHAQNRRIQATVSVENKVAVKK